LRFVEQCPIAAAFFLSLSANCLGMPIHTVAVLPQVL
jgi:hypothetical protein